MNRRRAAALGRGLAALAVAAAPLVVGVAPPVAAAADPQASLPVHVTLLAVDPVAPRRGTAVDVTARLDNTSDRALDRYDAELRLAFRPVPTRGELDADADAPRHFSSDVPSGARVDSSAPLQPGEQRIVRLRFAVDAARDQGLLRDYGVYQLGVEVHDPGSGNGIVGIANTFLPWLPTAYDGPRSWARVRVSWLWPLADVPHLDPSGALRGTALAGELAPGGRLATLLDAAGSAAGQHGAVRLPVPPVAKPRATASTRGPKGRAKGAARAPARHRPVLRRGPVPVAYVIDPALVEAATTLAAGKRDGHAEAAAFLSALRERVSGSDVVGLPYGDPDVSALARAGAEAELRSAENARDAVLAKAGFPKTTLGVAAPPGGFVSPEALEQLTAGYVVLDSGAAPLLTPRPYTPTAVTEISRAGGPITALLTDPVLGRIATGRVDGGETAAARQRFAAETAMIAAESPRKVRQVVVALPHRFDPRGTAAAELLAETGLLPWVDPVPLSDAVDAPTDPQAERGPLRYPGSARAAELPSDLAAGVGATGHEVADLRAILCPPAGQTDVRRVRVGCHPDTLALPVEHALLASGSSAWRGDVEGARALLASVDHRTRGYLGKVRVTTTGTVTLVSQSGSIPVTIANDLPLPVTVRLAITTPNRSQLRVDNTRLYVVPPGAKAQQTVQARTSSAGKARFPIFVQLLTPGGDRVGDRAELVVRSSAYGAIAVAITGGALVVLFGTVAFRLIRTALRARRRAGTTP